MTDYLPNLKNSIKTQKIGKAKTLLSELHKKHIQIKLDVLKMMALTPDKSALEILSYLTSEEVRDPEIHDRLIQLIIDRAHLNFNFIFILFKNGDSRTITQIVPLIRHILSKITDKQILNEIIRQSGKLQIESLVDDIAEFIFYDDRHLKAQAVKALERIGSSNACSRLIQASKTEKCDQDILDAIQILSTRKPAEAPAPVAKKPVPEKIAKKNEVQTFLKDMTSKDFQKRFDAVTELSLKEEGASEEWMGHLQTGSHDLKINLLWLVRRTIPVCAVNPIFDIIDQEKTPNTVKFAAYAALESYPELKSAASVLKGLSEPALFVRTAALRVLDKNLSDFVFAEIKNKIESGTKTGETLAINILDAMVENIIEQLMISDTFSYMASNYLGRTAPLPVLDTFISILEKRNLKSTAKKYIDMRKNKISQKEAPFIVISSCEATLNIYNKPLVSIGRPVKLFKHPQKAFDAIMSEKPAVIVCDLYLNEMTGFDIAREIRELYPKDDVPFVISTIQKDLDDTILEKEMDRSGVNYLCEFPARTSQIKSWIK